MNENMYMYSINRWNWIPQFGISSGSVEFKTHWFFSFIEVILTECLDNNLAISVIYIFPWAMVFLFLFYFFLLSWMWTLITIDGTWLIYQMLYSESTLNSTIILKSYKIPYIDVSHILTNELVQMMSTVAKLSFWRRLGAKERTPVVILLGLHLLFSESFTFFNFVLSLLLST
jgi:hypothetical protein